MGFPIVGRFDNNLPLTLSKEIYKQEKLLHGIGISCSNFSLDFDAFVGSHGIIRQNDGETLNERLQQYNEHRELTQGNIIIVK